MALGKNSRLLAPGPPRPQRPIRYNHWGQSQPLEVEVGLKKKKKKDKKGYSLLQAQSLGFKTFKKKKAVPAQGTEHQKLARPDACGHGAGPLLPFCTASKLTTPPPASNAHPTQLPAAAAAAAPLLRGVTPGHLRRRRDTGEAKGEGCEIQLDGLKVLEELLSHDTSPGID